MSKIWFVSAPLYSHTDWGGFLKTAQAVQARGHEVLWISGTAIETAVRGANIPFRAIRETGWLWPPPPAPDVSQMHPQEAVMLRYRRALDTWLSEDIVGEATQALIELAAEIGTPDLIVTDPFLSASALASEALGVKMAVAGWPAQGDLQADNLFPVQRNLSSDSMERLNRLKARFGVDGVNFSQGATPSIISPYVHICYFTKRWYIAEAETLLPQNVFVGGTITPPNDAPPAWLSAIPADVPIGLVTLGTTFTGDLGFFSWGAQAVASAGLLPVVAIGENPITPERKQELINALPRGTRLVNFVPFAHILPRTRLMIHHGGMGSTHYAVMYGVPQIVVPHAADQRVQARRVAQAKVGLNLTAHDVKQGQLMDGAQALLNHQPALDTARHLAQEMIALGGVERAADTLIDLL